MQIQLDFKKIMSVEREVLLCHSIRALISVFCTFALKVTSRKNFCALLPIKYVVLLVWYNKNWIFGRFRDMDKLEKIFHYFRPNLIFVKLWKLSNIWQKKVWYFFCIIHYIYLMTWSAKEVLPKFYIDYRAKKTQDVTLIRPLLILSD